MEIPLDDDVLRAALDFVDDFEPRKLSPARRFRLELVAFREQADELQRRFGQLESRRRDEDSVYRQLAACQRRRRRESEIENTQLRGLLRDHSRVIDRLAKLARTGRRNEIGHRTRSKEIKVPRPLTRVGRDRLLQESLGMYQQLTGIFSQGQFLSASRGEAPQRGVVFRKDTDCGREVEIFDLRPMPFHFERVGDAMWDLMRRPTVPGEIVWTQDVELTDTRLEREFMFRANAPSVYLTCDFRSHVVVCQCSFPDAVALQCVSEIETRVLSDESVRTFSTIEKIWVLVQPLAAGATTVALAQTYGTLTPCSEPARARNRNIQALETYIGSAGTHIEEHWGQVESRLLDDARERKKITVKELIETGESMSKQTSDVKC